VVDTRELVLERFRVDSRFVLATHEHPDGDALGSLVGLHGVLSELAKDAPMFIAPEDLPLPREYRIFSLEGVIEAPPEDILERTVVFLDCGNIDRNSACVLRDGRHLLNLDHHHDNTRFGTLNHVVPNASSTAEIVWDLMHGDRADADDSDAEGIVDQLRAVRGTKVAALVREVRSGERKGQRKVSLRATGDDVDVSVIARAQGGGGHRLAAGFSTTLEPDELIAFLRRAIATQLHATPDGHAATTLA
jgi:nanoRNase/pAp phosphatase (c-di-AMP/oligoRNAs hydrolase)